MQLLFSFRDTVSPRKWDNLMGEKVKNAPIWINSNLFVLQRIFDKL